MRKILVTGIVFLSLGAPAMTMASTCQTTGGTQAFDEQKLCVSSVLPAQGNNSYGIGSMIDDDERTAWCEGAVGKGVGEKIGVEWVNAAKLSRIWVSNGYAKSQDSFLNNGRVKDLFVVYWEQGAGDTDYELIKFQLKDHDRPQRIDIPEYLGPPARIVMEIGSVYNGAKWQDTCINEVWVDFGM